MKTLKKGFNRIAMNILLLFAVSTTMLAGNDIPTITITGSGFAKKFSVILEDLHAASEAKVLLKDKDGVVLLQENLKGQSSFAKIINLEALPAGDYDLVIDTKTRATIQPISLTENAVLLDTDNRQVRFHPIINQKDNFVDVSWFNTRVADVEVKLLDTEMKEVFGDKLEDVIKLERRYNLAQVQPGNYYLRVKTPFDVYYEEVSIK